MEFGTLLLMVGLAYGLGVLWYDLLPGRLPEAPWRVAAYPFMGIFLAEAILTPALTGVPLAFGGLHAISVLIGSLVAVILDWVITLLRHPAAVAHFEPRAA